MSKCRALEDGNLPAARIRISNAISALIDPKPTNRTLTDGTNRIEWLDSLYDQLCDTIPGGQGNNSHVLQSSPPICIDAAEIKHKIDHQTAKWEPRPNIDANNPNHQPLTIIRLQELELHPWRPQDTQTINDIAAHIEAWCTEIQTLLNPTPRWHLPNPCPACGKAVVYRHNSAGELVRQPALQVSGITGCTCQNCHHTWAPAHFVHLARVLNYDLGHILE